MKQALSFLALLLLAVGCAAPNSPAPVRAATLSLPGRDRYPVPAVDRPIALDGRLDPDEWLGLTTAAAMTLNASHDLEPARQPSQVWITRDRLWLYVAVHSQINPDQPLRKDSVWGENDGVELAFQAAGDPDAPVYILRGYPSMRFQIPSLGGAKPKEIERLSENTAIRAKLHPRGTSWTIEWKISLRALGLDPAGSRQVAFNVTVCKPGSGEMVTWRPATAETWRLDGKGILELAPQPAPRRIMVPGLTPAPER